MPLKAREVAIALTSKGFKPAERDHHFYFFWYKGKKTAIRTKISHGISDIDDKNCASMARQIRLNRNEFNSFVECPLTIELYIEKLINEKHLSEPAQLKTDQSKKDKSSRS